MKRKLLIVMVLFLIVGISLGGADIWAMGAPEFPTPSGPHSVGTLELALIDSDRLEKLGDTPGQPSSPL